MESDDLTAILAAIRQRYANTRAPITGNSVTVLFASASDVPRLLAAVEAVLALHQPVTTNGGWLEGPEWQECGECGPNNGQEGIYATPGKGEEFWPCPTRQAITAALAGTARENVSSSSAATREDGEP